MGYHEPAQLFQAYWYLREAGSDPFGILEVSTESLAYFASVLSVQAFARKLIRHTFLLLQGVPNSKVGYTSRQKPYLPLRASQF